MAAVRTETGETPNDINRKFRAAWQVFSLTCRETIASEATYQAWFAHYLISQFGIDRVAREPSFDHRRFTSPLQQRFRGNELKLDVVVARSPGLEIPQWVHRGCREVGGSCLLNELSVISELKVASTQGEGLDYTEICRDLWKLSMLLTECEDRGHR